MLWEAISRPRKSVSYKEISAKSIKTEQPFTALVDLFCNMPRNLKILTRRVLKRYGDQSWREKTLRGRFSSWPYNLRFAPCEVVEGNTGFGIHSFFLEFWTHDLWRLGRFPPFLGFWMPLNFVVGFPLSRGWALDSCHGVSDSRGKRSRWYRLLNYLMWGGQKL